MAKKAKTKKKVSKVKNTENDKEIRHLETLLKYSLKAVNSNTSAYLDELFTDQAVRIQEKICEIKGKQ